MKVAIWGIGAHAQRYLIPSLTREDSRLELFGCFSRNRENLEKICGDFDLFAFESPEDLLISSEIEGIVLATPSKLHASQGLSVLDNGKHLFSEKSLYLDGEEKKRFSSLSQDKKLRINEMFMFKFHPQHQMIIDIINSGKIGQVRFCNVSFTIPHLPISNNRYDPDTGGGALFDVGCYPIAFCHSVFGNDQEVQDSLLIFEEGYIVDTSGYCTLKRKDGMISNLQWGFGLTYTNKVEIFGSSGNLISKSIFSKAPSLSTMIEIYDSKGNSEKMEIEPTNHFDIMFDRLANSDGINWIMDQSQYMEKILAGRKINSVKS